jgi:hypothetical protein
MLSNAAPKLEVLNLSHNLISTLFSSTTSSSSSSSPNIFYVLRELDLSSNRIESLQLPSHYQSNDTALLDQLFPSLIVLKLKDNPLSSSSSSVVHELLKA